MCCVCFVDFLLPWSLAFFFLRSFVCTYVYGVYFLDFLLPLESLCVRFCFLSCVYFIDSLS